MITIEQVEYLKSKANISYEEAKGLLEKYNGDMLEAVTELERAGKIGKGKSVPKEKTPVSSIKGLFKKGYENRLVIKRKEDVIANLSINFTLLTFLIAGHFAFFTFLIILFMGYKISFKNETSGEKKCDMNEFFEKAKTNVADVVNNLVKE